VVFCYLLIERATNAVSPARLVVACRCTQPAPRAALPYSSNPNQWIEGYCILEGREQTSATVDCLVLPWWLALVDDLDAVVDEVA
jgi:hypothetical protein